MEYSAKRDNKTMSVDDFRQVLGQFPARNIDILGQLLDFLSKDLSNSSRLAYAWAPLLFAPRFDASGNSSLLSEYEGFDFGKHAKTMIAATKFMIDESAEIFALDDDQAVLALSEEITSGWSRTQ